MPRFIIICLLLLGTAGQAQQIYRTTDENGNVIFTDQPPAGADAERVELHRTNTAPPPAERPAADEAPPPIEAVEAAEAIEWQIQILDPVTETTIPMGPGNFAVNASVQPALGAEETLQLRMDGEPWGEPQQSANWELTNVFRGAHDITVAVIGPGGEELAASTPVRVYVLRPSVNFR